jgi:hypothetical protein
MPVSNRTPARLRVSGACPLCWQHGALKLVQPLGLDLARGGKRFLNLSTTSVIHILYYLYNILSSDPVLEIVPETTKVLTPE